MCLLVQLHKQVLNIEINPRAITLNKLQNGKIRRNKARKKYLRMAGVIDRRVVDTGLKEIARKKVEAVATEKAKLVHKQGATIRKTRSGLCNKRRLLERHRHC